jgi:hypothetical protein
MRITSVKNVSNITEGYLQSDQGVGALGNASMADIETAIYFRRLAARCMALSRDCLELRAKEELRKLAEELAAEANALEREQNDAVGAEHSSRWSQ